MKVNSGEHQQIIEEISIRIRGLYSKSCGMITPEILDEYRKLFLFAHKIAADYFNDGQISDYRYNIIDKINNAFRYDNLVNRFIILTRVTCDIADVRIKNHLITASLSESEFLDATVNEVRKYYYSFANPFDLNRYNLRGYCDLDAQKVKDICDTYHYLGIRCIKQEIYIGFERQSKFYHAFNIIIINGKKYIVDITYNQFFSYLYCFLERIGIPLFLGCSAGRFMFMNEHTKNVAETILNRGWIEYSPDNLRAYLGGFVVSFRNGLWYDANELTREMSLERLFYNPYSFEQLESFLRGEDNQFNHEDPNHTGLLGTQNRCSRF